MRGIFTPLITRLRRTNAQEPTTAEHGTTQVEDRLTARALADAIDRAMALGLWEHADRLAETAKRLVSTSARLTERLARLRLAQGDPDTALALIDSPATSRDMPASLRLLRAACLVQLGRKDQAHSDLMRWSKRSTAPLDARLMLALLEWETGDEHSASLALMRNLKHLEDPRSLELLLLIAVQQDRQEQSQNWAERLQLRSAFSSGSAHANLLCCTLLMPPNRASVKPTKDQISTLAMELVTAEQVIPALAEAQRLRPQEATAGLIYFAIEHALDDLSDQNAAIEALATLAMVLGERESAEAWAERGLKLNPISTVLSEILARLTDARFSEDGLPSVLATIGRSQPESERSEPGQEKAA